VTLVEASFSPLGLKAQGNCFASLIIILFYLFSTRISAWLSSWAAAAGERLMVELAISEPHLVKIECTRKELRPAERFGRRGFF